MKSNTPKSIKPVLIDPGPENKEKEINWKDGQLYSSFTERFIEENADKVYWELVADYCKLSEEFMDKNSNRLDWRILSSRQVLSEKLIAKQAHCVCWGGCGGIFHNQKVSETFLRKYMFWFENKGEDVWAEISSHCELSAEFIETYSNKVHWEKILRHQKLSKAIIKDNWKAIMTWYGQHYSKPQPIKHD